MLMVLKTYRSGVDRTIMKSVGWFLPYYVTPNHITVFRFITIPFIVYFLLSEYDFLAMILFVISAYSDAVDGALARTTNRVTEWGKLCDPLADKLLIGTVAAIVVTKYVGVYLAGVLVLIELVLILNALYYRRFKRKIIEARFPGKAKMVCQSFGISFLLLYIILGSAPLLVISIYILFAAIFFGLVSLFAYRSI